MSTNNTSDIAGKVGKIDDKAPVEQKQYGDFLGMYKGCQKQLVMLSSKQQTLWNPR